MNSLALARRACAALGAAVVIGVMSTSAGAAGAAACGSSRSIAADLTGSGTRERVELRVVGSGSTCHALLRASVRGREVATRVTIAPGGAPGTLALVGAHDVNDRRGAELVVRVWRGAAADFFRVYTFSHGAFTAMRVPGTSAPAADAFPFGGPLGSDDTVTCAGRGLVVHSAGSLVAKRWRVRRAWYTASATGFALSRSVTLGVSRLRSIEEFRIGEPFATCR